MLYFIYIFFHAMYASVVHGVTSAESCTPCDNLKKQYKAWVEDSQIKCIVVYRCTRLTRQKETHVLPKGQSQGVEMAGFV